jgi:hypothetical protein
LPCTAFKSSCKFFKPPPSEERARGWWEAANQAK